MVPPCLRFFRLRSGSNDNSNQATADVKNFMMHRINSGPTPSVVAISLYMQFLLRTNLKG